MIIYKITNKINGKCYIGQTAETLEKRVKRHFGYQSIENDTKFYRAIRKYGRDNFECIEIDSADNQKELDEKEIFWINFYDSANNGYNTRTTQGKCGGDTLTNNPNLDIIRQKISKAVTGGNNPHAVKIKSIDVTTMEIKIFNSMSECQKFYNIKRHDIISRRCRHIINKPYNNKLLFEYI